MDLSSLNTNSICDLVHKGQDLYRTGNYCSALKEFSSAVKETYDLGKLFIIMGMAYEKLGNAFEAIKSYEVASYIQDANYLLSNYLGELFYKTSQFKKAATYQVKSLKYNDKHIYSWVGLGYAEMATNEYDSALKAFDQAISIDPRWVNALIGKAQVLIKFSENKQASELLQKALKIEPGREDVVSILKDIDKDFKVDKKNNEPKFPFISFANRPSHHDIKVNLYRSGEDDFINF